MITQDRGRKPSVLAVDDDPLTLTLLETHLAISGYPLLRARNSDEAYELVRRRRPRIVILNWMMRQFDGPAFCSNLRRMGSPAPYTILLAERTAPSLIVEALESGADDYLTHPIEAAELFARVRAGHRTMALKRSLAARTLRGERMARRLTALNNKLDDLTSTDELTGLLNRRSGLQRLDEQWRLAVRYDQPMACAMFDIDGLRRFNEKMGELRGDDLLRRAGEVLRKTARDSDLLVRYGGEEFLIILPNQTEEAGARAAERYRAAFEAATIGLTISAGVCARGADSANPERILRHADAALYAAKRRGKNCVRRASEILRAPSAA